MQTKLICPICETTIPHTYDELIPALTLGLSGVNFEFHDKYMVLTCYHCEQDSIWDFINSNMKPKVLWPRCLYHIKPNEDMPEDIKVDFEEARQIANDSPRAAAALLRLCLQKLLVHIGGPGKTIDKDIATLVKEGVLPAHLQKACDTLRVLGNNAVHPDKIGLDLNDNREIVKALFKLVNMLVQEKISNMKEIDELYDLIPENLQKSIEARDSKK